MVMRRARSRTIAGLRRDLRLESLSGLDRQRWDRALSRYLRARARLDDSAEAEWEGAVEQPREEDVAELRGEEVREALSAALAVLDRGKVAARPRAPAKGELMLGYLRLSDRWLGFASRASEVRVGEIDGGNWLDPFEAEIRDASRITFLTEGDTAWIDFHALHFQGAPLGASREVVYALDLEPSRSEPRPQNGVVLIGDPRGDLPGARDEVRAVAARHDHNSVELILGREASRERVVRALAGAALVHYAGHGQYGGDDGWDSALPLAGGAALTVADILALPAVPPRVVLSGCETAETSTLAGQQLGLAQAFVLAGAEEVVAASRPVRDRTARRISELLHQERDVSLARSLQRAQRHLREEDPTADWAAFRVIVP
jgi:hypothetical protein